MTKLKNMTKLHCYDCSRHHKLLCDCLVTTAGWHQSSVLIHCCTSQQRASFIWNGNCDGGRESTSEVEALGGHVLLVLLIWPSWQMVGMACFTYVAKVLFNPW